MYIDAFFSCYFSITTSLILFSPPIINHSLLILSLWPSFWSPLLSCLSFNFLLLLLLILWFDLICEERVFFFSLLLFLALQSCGFFCQCNNVSLLNTLSHIFFNGSLFTLLFTIKIAYFLIFGCKLFKPLTPIKYFSNNKNKNIYTHQRCSFLS